MIVIPAIDLLDGQCVRLTQGDFAQKTIYSAQPVAIAQTWEAQGAGMLHIVDLDGARDGDSANRKVITEIARTVRIPVEVGGGIRTLRDVEDLLDAGVLRVVLGTMVFENRPLFETVLRKYPAHVVVALETRNGTLLSRGWRKSEPGNVLDVARELAEQGVQRFLYTDVSKDGTLTEPNYAEITDLMRATSARVIASGGVSTVEALRQLQTLGVEGAIVGKALYEDRLTIPEIINVG